jgi:hypothetical protein
MFNDMLLNFLGGFMRITRIVSALFLFSSVASAIGPGGGCIQFLPTIEHIQTLVQNRGVQESLIRKINAAGLAETENRDQTSLNILNAFQQEVSALTVQQIDPQAAAVLQNDALELIQHVQAHHHGPND